MGTIRVVCDGDDIKYHCLEHDILFDEMPEGDTTPVSKFQPKPVPIIEDIHGRCILQEIDLFGRLVYEQHGKEFIYAKPKKPPEAIKDGPILTYFLNAIGLFDMLIEKLAFEFKDCVLLKKQSEL